MRGDVAGHRHVGPRGLDELRSELSQRDVLITGQVAELRLMSTRQIRAIHFPDSDHDNELAAARAGQRDLSRLVRDRVLVRLQRRVGGVRAGSSGFIYGLGPLGQRILEIEGPRRRYHEPTLRFLDHMLTVSQLVVDMTLAARLGEFDVLSCQAEPRCHREFSGFGGRTLLRPDLFVALGVADLEHRWFIEVDRGSESVPVVVRKCRTYSAYYQSGREQATHGVFPRVCWIVPDERRVGAVRRAIARDQRLEDRLFTVTVTATAVVLLSGRTP